MGDGDRCAKRSEVRTKDSCRRQWREQSMIDGGMQSGQGGRHVSHSKSFSNPLTSLSLSIAIRSGGLLLEAVSKLEKYHSSSTDSKLPRLDRAAEAK